jgi:uncharacterized OsmC-like protein
MDQNLIIKSALDRMFDIYQKRPKAALSTESTRGVIGDGLKCSIQEGDNTFVADLPKAMGGEDAGPTPGYYARAGIIGCVAIGIKMAAARACYDFRRVDVRLECDFDDRAFYRLCDQTAAPIETRITIAIDCDLSEMALTEFVAEALSRDTWFLALRDAQTVKTSVAKAGRN